MTAAYWWSVGGNFGDLLTPVLLNHFAEVTTTYATPSASEIVVAGSVLDVIPDGWQGIVAGAGKLHERTKTDLRDALVLGLRGQLTAKHVKLPKHADIVIGDPGLLASELVLSEEGKYKLGVVPHWSDTELFQKELAQARRYKYAEPICIPATGDPLEIIAKIGSCKKIVTSSLHGAVVADSFGIPRRLEPFARMAHASEGNTFKFRDYSSAIGIECKWGELQVANPQRVAAVQFELFDLFTELAAILHA